MFERRRRRQEYRSIRLQRGAGIPRPRTEHRAPTVLPRTSASRTSSSTSGAASTRSRRRRRSSRTIRQQPEMPQGIRTAGGDTHTETPLANPRRREGAGNPGLRPPVARPRPRPNVNPWRGTSKAVTTEQRFGEISSVGPASRSRLEALLRRPTREGDRSCSTSLSTVNVPDEATIARALCGRAPELRSSRSMSSASRRKWRRACSIGFAKQHKVLITNDRRLRGLRPLGDPFDTTALDEMRALARRSRRAWRRRRRSRTRSTASTSAGWRRRARVERGAGR